MASGLVGAIGGSALWKVAIRFKIGQENCQTGFKLRDLAVNDNTAEDVVNAVDLWVTNFFRALLLTADQLVAVDAIKIGGEEGSEKLYPNLFGSSGINAADGSASFMAVNVALKTSRRKRYGQGRMFLPFRRDQDADQNFLNNSGIAAFQGAVDGLTDAFSGSVLTHDLALVNVHGILPARAATATTPARPEIPATWYDVETVKINRTVTALRSRKAGIGA